jgi:hypothetical protein
MECRLGLPDCIFTNQKSKFVSIWEGLGMENVGIFYSQLDFLGQFCIFNGHLVIFWLFGILCQEKSGSPGAGATATRLWRPAQGIK